MSPGGGARATVVLGPLSQFPIPVLGTSPNFKPLPLAQALSQAYFCLTKACSPPRGSGFCTRKGGSRSSKVQEEGGWWSPRLSQR